jgi:transcriptional regulator with XRE-family HTH domain
MHDEMAINAQRLRSLREQRGWSQEQLADVSGLSARTIQRVEATGAASLETRMALAAALELAPADLLVPAQASRVELLPPVHPSVARPSFGQHPPLLTMLLLVALLVFAQMIFGYIVGRDMANRDDARVQQETAGGGG